MDDVTGTPIGNVPIMDLERSLHPDNLSAWIEYEYAGHAARIASLMVRFQKFETVTADGIRDDTICGYAADYVEDLRAASRDLDATRTKIKRPVLHAQRMIDGEAKKLSDQAGGAANEVGSKISAFLQAKEAAARAALEAEAMARAADPQGDAVTAMAEVQAVEEMTPADLTRMRSPGGSVVSLKQTWSWEVVDITQVPAIFLQLNDQVVRAAVRSGTRSIPGLRIYPETKAAVR